MANSIPEKGKKIFTTKKPFNFYLTVILLLITTILFLIIAYVRQLDKTASISLFFVGLMIGIVIYANFGQYLAIISLYENSIEINYIFPWNRSKTFGFSKFAEMDYKDMPFQNGRDRWYIGGKWLYLKNEHGEVCQFKYNINNASDKMLLEELRKKCIK